MLPVLIILLSACSQKTYYQANHDTFALMHAGDFQAAIGALKANRFLKKDNNRMLLLLESGRIAHLAGNYSASNTFLNEADEMMDSWSEIRQRTIYGRNLGTAFGFMDQFLTGFLGSTDKLNYRTDDFEKVMIHYYKALNYLYLDLTDEALVEAKQLDLLMDRLDDKKYAEPGFDYVQQAFPHLLIGLIYENNADYDNALIAYEEACRLYASSSHYQLYGVQIPKQLKKDLLNAAYRSGSTEKLEFYCRQWNMSYKKNVQQSELVFLYESGFIPHREQVKMEWNTTYTYNEKNKSYTVPATLVYLVPRYLSTPAYCNFPEMDIDSEELQAENVYDMQYYTTHTVNKRFTSEGDYFLAHSKAKSSGVNTKNRRADTRHWQSLPGCIYYCRTGIDSSTHNLEICCSDSAFCSIKIKSQTRFILRSAWK